MTNVGFIQISVPCFPSYMCEKLDQLQAQYFSLPKSEKNKIRLSPEYPYGYECNEILSNSFDEENEGSGHSELSTKESKIEAHQNDFKETFQVCLSKRFVE